MLQFTTQRKYEQTEDEYYAKIGRKTAVLMATSTFCGAVTSDQPKEAVAALERYGHLLGMAFQIADDVLDYLATEAEVGKPVGNDLKEGTVTLPLMLALQDPGVDGGLRRVLDRPNLTDADYAEVVAIVRHSRAIDESYEVARRFGEQARAALAPFPPSSYKDALEELTHYVVRRRN
jgi:geranylgeranyl pyrophosphate synthase